jgi:S-adenosylhomocysteine hydrolase
MLALPYVCALPSDPDPGSTHLQQRLEEQMRPLAEIPPAFLNPTDQPGDVLPLVERWLVSLEGQAPLRGHTILLVQHQLTNHAAQAAALVRLGAEPRRMYWLDVPYTSHAVVRKHVQDKLGIPKDNFWVSDDYRTLEPYGPYQLRRTVEAVLAVAKSNDFPLLVLDDGAYVLEALAVLRPQRWPRKIAIVEQTSRGMIKLASSAALQLIALQVPLVDVARSTPKRTLEPPFIAMSICASLQRSILRRKGRAPSGRCLVLGYGAIGEQVATFLDHEFAFGRSNVFVSDVDPEACQKAARRKFPIWDRRDLKTRFDLIVGCSGRSSFGLGDYVYLEDGALLVSASSGAVEMSRAEFIEHADASELDDVEIVRSGLDEQDVHADLVFRLVDRSAIFANAGFPVNFDGRISTTPGRFIQATPVMMLGAAIQAAKAIAPGVVELDGTLCEWLDREFREILGEDAHLLVPPPEEAW